MGINIPAAVLADLNAGFVITDRDNYFQRAKALGSGEFQFKTGFPGVQVRIDDIEYTGQSVEGTVDVNGVSDAEKQSLIAAYYGTQSEFEASVNAGERAFAIAEMWYETHLENGVYEAGD